MVEYLRDCKRGCNWCVCVLEGCMLARCLSHWKSTFNLYGNIRLLVVVSSSWALHNPASFSIYLRILNKAREGASVEEKTAVDMNIRVRHLWRCSWHRCHVCASSTKISRNSGSLISASYRPATNWCWQMANLWTGGLFFKLALKLFVVSSCLWLHIWNICPLSLF